MEPSEKSVLMDKIFALTTENIEVGSWKKQLGLKHSYPSRFQVIGVGIGRKSEKCSAKGLALA